MKFSLLQLLIRASYRHFKGRLPEAICYCLQTCTVKIVLLVMNVMYIYQLTLTHGMQEGYGTCLLCVSVCLSVTKVSGATAFLSTLKARFILVFFSLILEENHPLECSGMLKPIWK